MNRPARATTSHQPTRAVLYVRVSSKEQDVKGFSLNAQRRLLHEYADGHEIRVEKEFVAGLNGKRTRRTLVISEVACQQEP
jgi:DNA invertase Pin-like site-specific DNA recombinase